MVVAGMNFSAQGRVSRLRFWLELIGNFVTFAVVFGAFYIVMERAKDDSGRLTLIQIPAIAGMVVIAIANTWAQTCVAIRRLHDRNKTGWWYLLVLVPYIGAIWFLIDCGLLKGAVGSNRFGPDPLSPPHEAIGQVFEAG